MSARLARIGLDKSVYQVNSFLTSRQNIHCGYSLEMPQRGASNEYLQHTFLLRNKKNIDTFWLKKAPYQELCSPEWQHSFVEIDHEIFSTVILSLPLIQEGQLSVSGERMCTILVNRLED